MTNLPLSPVTRCRYDRVMKGPAQISELAEGLLDPVLRRRAGMSLGLVQSWDEVAGQRIARSSRPLKIVWPRRAGDDDPFEPATLVVACEAAAALHLQHETTEIIARVNAFLGFAAIGRIRILQKPVADLGRPRRLPLPEIGAAEEARVAGLAGVIEDEGLRKSLEALGRSVMASRRRG
jgi:hypothetical protein